MSSELLWNDRKRTLFGLPLSFTKYSLSNERLFIETGLFNTVENEVRLYRIMDIQLEMKLSQKIFGVGTIHVKSGDKTLKDFDLLNIKNPRMVKEMLSELVEKNRVEKRVSNREMMLDEFDSDESDVDS